MIKIPAYLSRQYSSFIIHQGVAPQKQQYYLKWLRFFLDFCRKYNFKPELDTSLTAFLEKLREKRQSEQQRQQAGHAITLYFKLIIQDTAKSTNSPPPQEQVFLKNKTSPTKNIEICQESKLLGEPIAQQHEHETAKILVCCRLKM